MTIDKISINNRVKGNDIIPPIDLKLAGDGAPVSRVTSILLLSFSFPSIQDSLPGDREFEFSMVYNLH